MKMAVALPVKTAKASGKTPLTIFSSNSGMKMMLLIHMAAR